jgi:hypothetical protein
MSDRFGQAFGLTLLSPIIADDSMTRHSLLLRDELAGLGPDTFAKVPSTHLARWVILDDASFEGIPAKVDHFASKYLVFTSNFDGVKDDSAAFDDYLELMRTQLGDVVTRVYRHCVGFPGVKDAAAFRDYFRRCRIPTSFLFGAYPTATVPDVLHALDAQRRMAEFVARHQSRTMRENPAALKDAFLSFMKELRSAPLPRPGSV